MVILSQRCKLTSPHAFRVIVALVACVGLLLGICARPAYAADSGAISKDDIDMTVGVDGSLSVVESHTFDFHDATEGVYCGTSTQPSHIRPPFQKSSRLIVDSVTDVTQGDKDLNQSQEAHVNGTYRLTDLGDNTTCIEIYDRYADTQATIRVAYKITNVVNAWADTGELFWKFAMGWNEGSQAITCRIHLPVASGQAVVAGDNVRAWGHGPRDGLCSFDGNDVVYTVPSLSSKDYAEARIMFPVSWLSAVTPSSTKRASTIMDEDRGDYESATTQSGNQWAQTDRGAAAVTSDGDDNQEEADFYDAPSASEASHKDVHHRLQRSYGP